MKHIFLVVMVVLLATFISQPADAGAFGSKEKKKLPRKPVILGSLVTRVEPVSDSEGSEEEVTERQVSSTSAEAAEVAGRSHTSRPVPSEEVRASLAARREEQRRKNQPSTGH